MCSARHKIPRGYAAVIPKWIAALIQGETVYINGDGDTSRDFVSSRTRCRQTCSRPELLTRAR